MKANDIKTYRGFNSQDIMLTGSQYNALRRNIANANKLKHDTPGSSNKRNTKSSAKKQVFINQAKKLSEDIQKEKIRKVQSDNMKTAASSNRSIMQYINIQTDKLISRIDDKTARVSPELQYGLSKMKDQIQKAVLEFINDCYMPYMRERLQVMILQYQKEVVAAVEECCDVIGDQLSEYEAKQIMAQCYRELADGRLHPGRINYFIASRWETACNYKIAHNQI